MANLLYLLPLYEQSFYFLITIIVVRNMYRPIWAIIKEFTTTNESTQSIHVCPHANNTYVNIQFKTKNAEFMVRIAMLILKAPYI